MHTCAHAYTHTHMSIHTRQEAGSMEEYTGDIIVTGGGRNELQAGRNLTAEAMQRFIAFIDAKPKTVQTYTRALRQLFAYLAVNGQNAPLRDDIISFREDLKASGHKPTTVCNYINAARLFFQWTEQEGIYPNIAAHIKGAKLDRQHKKDYLTSRQVKGVMGEISTDTLKGLRDYAILALMVTGGLRTIEVARADIGDLRTLGDNTVLYVQGKGRDEKTDYVKIDPKVEAAIRRYLKCRAVTDPGAPLFASVSNNNNGQRMTTRAISGTVKARLVAAGYNSDKLTAHSLRHTAVTLSLLAGKDLTEVQEFARHSNIATTMIYNHTLDKSKNGCAEAIAQAIL